MKTTTRYILLIEDHKDFREAVRNFLDQHHIHVHMLEASSGEEGILIASKKKPKIVIMDFGLGGINGLETAKRIKKCLPQCKIIMLTIYDPKEISDKDNHGLIYSYINKGNLYEQLIPAIKKLLNQ